MIKWKNTKINLGEIPQNSTVKVLFKPVEGGCEQIQSVTPGCRSCTKLLSVSNKGVELRYKNGSFPTHLKKTGVSKVSTQKTVTINYIDGTSEKLRFNSVTIL